MEKIDEINSIMEEYYNLLKEIDDRNKKIKLAKFISSRRIESINTANEELKQENKELLKIKLEQLNTSFENDLKKIKEMYDESIIKRKEQYSLEKEELNNKFDESNMKLFDCQREIEHLKKLNETPDFKNVDIKQIIDLKLKNTKKLILLKYDLEKEINLVKNELEMQKLKETLKRSDECLKLMELTKDEKEVLDVPMTKEELLEYRLRDEKIKLTVDDNTIPFGVYANQLFDTKIEEIDLEKSENKIESTKQQVLDDIFISENDIISTRDRTSLLKMIYDRLIKGANNLSSIKLDYSDNIHAKVSLRTSQGENYIEQDGFLDLHYSFLELTEGEYLNKEKIIESLNSLANNYKYTTFITKDTKKEYIISPEDVFKLITKLEKFTALDLVKGTGLTSDGYIIYGRQDKRNIFIGSENYNVNINYGNYISNDELIYELNKVITSRKLEKFETLSNRLKKILKLQKKYRSKHDAVNEMLNNESIELADEHVLRK